MPQKTLNSPKYGPQILYFDEEDRELVENHTWYPNKNYNTFYAHTNIPHPDGGWYEWTNKKTGKVKRRKRQTALLFHRAVMNAPKGLQVDHINGNGLDNRRSNLRLCTNAENSRNKGSIKNSSSEYKGVYWDKARGKWCAQIKFNGKNKRIGYYIYEEEAARACDEKAIELHGEFAKLNFPNTDS